MSMFVWGDGTVTGSVDVVELEAIRNALKPLGKAKLAELAWPVTSAAQVAELLAAQAEADAKAAKAPDKKKEG
jgi:hypothetical protein